MDILTPGRPRATDLDVELLRRLRALAPVQAENRLMRVSDREIALAIFAMGPQERGRILSILAVEKRRRVEQETRLLRRLAIRPEQRRTAIAHLIQLVGSERYTGSLSGYLRPLARGR